MEIVRDQNAQPSNSILKPAECDLWPED
jgi:hypothetical protein